MHLAVIGAGVVGVTTAFELARDGHQVTVFERRAAVAEESSFGNAGVIAPGYVTPWAAPGMPGKVLRYLLRRHAPIRLGLPLSGADLAWIWRWLRACNLTTYQRHRSALQQLAFYSRERLHQISAELRLDFERSQGYLVLLRADAEWQLVQPGLQILREAGVNFSEIDAAQARQLEPGLNPATDFKAAIHLPDDEVGNCREFSQLLRSAAQRSGVKFRFNTTVARIEPASQATLFIANQAAAERFDGVVLCAGVVSAELLRPLGIDLPLVPVYGYSITAPIRQSHCAPRSAVMDERYKVAITRLGHRVRAAGSAELGGTLAQHRAAALRTLYQVLHDWFAGAAQLDQVQEWKGMRPMLPDRPPLVCASGLPGLWLNLGHGSSGWALSCGSARAVADLVSQRAPALDLSGFALNASGRAGAAR